MEMNVEKKKKQGHDFIVLNGWHSSECHCCEYVNAWITRGWNESFDSCILKKSRQRDVHRKSRDTSCFSLKQEWALYENIPCSCPRVQCRAVEAGRMTYLWHIQRNICKRPPKISNHFYFLIIFTFGCVQMKAGQVKFTFRHEATQSAQWG